MTPLQSWAALLMALALAITLIHIARTAGRHRNHPDRIDWDAHWGDRS